MSEGAIASANRSVGALALSLSKALAPVRTRWQATTPRERRLVLLAGGVLSLALFWLVAVMPAWRTLQKAPEEKARLDRQLSAMQAMAQEAASLRAAPVVTQAQAALALKSAVARLGAKAQLVAQGDRYVITLNGVELGELGPWLDELRAGARTRPVELNLTRTAAGYSGSLVLATGGGP